MVPREVVPDRVRIDDADARFDARTPHRDEIVDARRVEADERDAIGLILRRRGS